MIAKKIFLNLGYTLLLGLFFISSAASAPPPDTPSHLEYVIVISAEKTMDLMKKGVPIIDTRVAHEYVEEHIQGAISVPYKEKSAKRIDYDPSADRFNLSKLPEDKSAPIIFYCNAGKCWKSYKASKAAIAAGHKNVYWLRGGIPEWKDKGYPVE